MKTNNFKKYSLIATGVMVGALASGALYADEEKPKGPELYVSGYMTQTMRLTDQKYGESANFKDSNGNKLISPQYPSGFGFHNVPSYNQIYFNAGASTDSGLEYSANYEIDLLPKLEVYRAYLEFGTGYGRFQMGKASSAISTNLIDGSSVLSGTGGWNGQAGVPMFGTDDSSFTMVGNKLGYFSPNIGYYVDDYTKPAKIAYQSNKYDGLSFGYSFTPAGYTLSAAKDGNGNPLIDLSQTSADNAFVNVHNVTANYEYETTDYGVFLFAGYLKSNNANESYHGARAYSLGAKFTRGELAVAAGHHNFGRGGNHRNDRGNNGTITDIAVGYELDEVTVGVGYGVYRGNNSNIDSTFSPTGDAPTKVNGSFYSAGMASEIAKGLSGYLEYNQYNENQNVGTGNATLEQREVLAGFALSF